MVVKVLLSLLVLQDNIGVVVDHNGKLSHSGEGNLSWSESPTSVVIQPPYALARLSRFIEVSSSFSSLFLIRRNYMYHILFYLL